MTAGASTFDAVAVRQPRTAAAATRATDWLPALIGLATALQALWLARLYPEHRFDPDLLAYFTFFRNWLHDDPTIHAMPYFTAPKLLLVFTLGGLGDATLAFYCSVAASAALGIVFYLVCRDHFGRPTAALAACVLLLDSGKAMLTLKSSADLYLALLLFLAVWLNDRGRVWPAAWALLGAALVKPVALPCSLCLLFAAAPRRRRWAAFALPFAAVPLMLLGNRALLGDAFSGAQFFREFASMGGADAIGPSQVLHFALWDQLVKTRFVATASIGFAGLLMWIAADRARLRSALLLMPALFLGGYWALSVVTPFPPYFRYFWPLELWFLGFVVFGAVEGGRRLAAGERRLQVAIVAVVMTLLVDAMVGRALDYHRDYAQPNEMALRFADAAAPILRAHRVAGEGVMVPLGLLPYMLWQFPDIARDQLVLTAERVARDDAPVHPRWVLHIPAMYTSDRTRQAVPQVLDREGLTPVLGNDRAMLFGPAAETQAGNAG
jgi:hypothetical protein